MGQVIGKIMPLPKGEYDPTVVYNVIDLVTHNNCLWIAKKSDILDVEPSEENSEYWMLAVKDNTEWQQLYSELLARDTELRMVTLNAGSTEEEVNNFYDNYSKNMNNFTHYRALVQAGFGHSILGGGQLYLEGHKTTSDYEYQEVTSYATGANNPKSCKLIRCKLSGEWSQWAAVDIGNVLTVNKNVYVDAVNGNDTTGDGSQTKPWATIQKAVNECPSASVNSSTYTIYIADGEYNETTIGIHEKTKIVIKSVSDTPNIIINGRLSASDDTCIYIDSNLTINTSGASSCITATDGSLIYIRKPLTLNCETGSGIIATYLGQISIMSGANGTFINGSKYGIRADGGIVFMNSNTHVSFGENITNKMYTTMGGKISIGTQGWITIGSVTGANSVTIDSNLYTEFMVKVLYNGYRYIICIPTASLSSGSESYNGGSKDHAFDLKCSNTQIQLTSLYTGNTNNTPSTTMTVYGRRA